MATIKGSTAAAGKIKAVSISEKKGTRKINVLEAQLKVGFGVEKDAHAGNWHRQVSLLAVESIRKMTAKGLDIGAGDFAENITTEGINLQSLPLGTKLKVGPEAEVEITQFGKKCHSDCEIFQQIGDCIMPREGVFAIVTKPGRVKPGDRIEVSQQND